MIQPELINKRLYINAECGLGSCHEICFLDTAGCLGWTDASRKQNGEWSGHPGMPGTELLGVTVGADALFCVSSHPQMCTGAFLGEGLDPPVAGFQGIGVCDRASDSEP